VAQVSVHVLKVQAVQKATVALVTALLAQAIVIVAQLATVLTATVTHAQKAIVAVTNSVAQNALMAIVQHVVHATSLNKTHCHAGLDPASIFLK
jgi:hypothetical protein